MPETDGANGTSGRAASAAGAAPGVALIHVAGGIAVARGSSAQSHGYLRIKSQNSCAGAAHQTKPKVSHAHAGAGNKALPSKCCSCQPVASPPCARCKARALQRCSKQSWLMHACSPHLEVDLAVLLVPGGEAQAGGSGASQRAPCRALPGGCPGASHSMRAHRWPPAAGFKPHACSLNNRLQPLGCTQVSLIRDKRCTLFLSAIAMICSTRSEANSLRRLPASSTSPAGGGAGAGCMRVRLGAGGAAANGGGGDGAGRARGREALQL